MTKLALHKAADDPEPVLLADDETVPPGASGTLSADSLAEWAYGYVDDYWQAGWKAGVEAGVTGLVESMSEKWGIIVNDIVRQLRPQLEAQIEAEYKARGQGALPPITVQAVFSGPLEIASSPTRVTRRKVMRDKQGRIVETIDVAEDLDEGAA
jgi:hypothetical protein